jgi:hypothetical protein
MTHVAKADVTIKFSVMIPFKDNCVLPLKTQVQSELKESILFCCQYANEFSVDMEIQTLDIIEMND